MSGEFPLTARIVSPVKCNEKPWDLWVSEIGHSSPLPDDVAEVESKGPHPYKVAGPRQRRAGINRLKYESMNLHGMFPQMDNLNAAVCHMCGATVKCSAVSRHLLEYHNSLEPIRPPPPPAPTVKLKSVHKSKHKKEFPPPQPVDILPVKMETSPLHTATAPLSRLVMSQPEQMQYLDEASTSAGVTAEVQVCVQSGELPVVSIQDTEDLPLGDNITDDIFAIMNSEGIQSADDITNSADWKNIIRDIGNMQDINFSQPSDAVQSQDVYGNVDAAALSAYALTDTDLTSLQFANTPNLLPTVMDTTPLSIPTVKPVAAVTPTSKSSSRSKSSKTKFSNREYDPNKHCGVLIADSMKPCTRSLTCKAHALSLRRLVEGRAKPFDQLLAEHRASREASLQNAANAQAHANTTPPTAPVAVTIPQTLLVNTQLDLGSFNGLSAEQQVNDIYASLLSVEDPNAVLPDTSSLTSLLSQPLPVDSLFLNDEEVPTEVPILSIASPVKETIVKLEEKEIPAPVVPSEVCWYATSPRPLALCTYNTAHAGGAITLGKRFATVRSNIKSSLSRSQCKAAGSSNSYYFGQNPLSLSKTVHMNNASKSNKPEVRKLIVTCSATGGSASFGEVSGGLRHTLNGHIDRRSRISDSYKSVKRPSSSIELGFVLDPLLADEKC